MINSILKAIDILQVFSPAEPRLSLAEIAVRLDLPKSTAHNLLQTLLSRGLVEKVDSDHYALGTTLITLTQGVRVNVELRDRAAPLLRELADLCRESVLLAILDGSYLLYVYAIESRSRLLARTAVGVRVPLHCTAIGKAILAHLPQAEAETILTSVGMAPSTEATITDLPTMWKELELTRQRGFSIDRQEHESATFCIGAPIFDASGRILAACSISGTDPEIIHGRLDLLSQHVMQCSNDISRLLGYIPARQALVAPRIPMDTRMNR